MEENRHLSPTSLKLKAVREDLTDLDTEISLITEELNSYDQTSQNYYSPLTKNSRFSSSKINSYQSPSSRQSNTQRYGNQNPSFRTPIKNQQSQSSGQNRTQNNSKSMQLNEIMTDGDYISCKSQISNNFENSQSEGTFHSNHSNSLYSNSSISKQDEGNRLFSQSVSILQKRSHNLYSNSSWNNTSEDDSFYFPKNHQKKSNYKSITEPERIVESMNKRKTVALKYEQDKEAEFEIHYPFKPTKMTPSPKVSKIQKEKILLNKKMTEEQLALEIEENNSPKLKKFIDPNSEKIAKNVKRRAFTPTKENFYEQKRGESYQESELTDRVTISKKDLQKSIERLTQIKDSTEVENETEKDSPLKKVNQKVINRLFYESTNSEKEKNLQKIQEKNSKRYQQAENFQKNNLKNPTQNDLHNNTQSNDSQSNYSHLSPNSRKIIEKSGKRIDLFENSIQVAEERFQQFQNEKKYKEMCEIAEFSYCPQINKMPNFNIDFHNTYSGNNYMKNEYKYSKSPERDAHHKLNYSPRHKNENIRSQNEFKHSKVSEQTISDILAEVDMEMNGSFHISHP
ncbi:hypothetical protein TRFO_10377 [Tritrichomonas foetus]|uniref:Uncharacterized protein n=1 Tax=Tritrichomonas foetus TaxID=1144522 RepID=A0A1J4JBV3_9EUKA|nr:hypothetical protein TRFO_10377 [Tritrichomonas foetus]|eukprot:OHS95727.1 hypothetical protein TRFO_10377 [Tritrichomonas foetus]